MFCSLERTVPPCRGRAGTDHRLSGRFHHAGQSFHPARQCLRFPGVPVVRGYLSAVEVPLRQQRHRRHQLPLWRCPCRDRCADVPTGLCSGGFQRQRSGSPLPAGDLRGCCPQAAHMALSPGGGAAEQHLLRYRRDVTGRAQRRGRPLRCAPRQHPGQHLQGSACR